MSDMEFDCPECGGALVIDAAGAGLTVNCRLCSKPIRVPNPEDARDQTTVKVVCPHCDQHLEVPEDLLGTVVACPSCNKQIQLPAPAPVSSLPPRLFDGVMPARQPPPILVPATNAPVAAKCKPRISKLIIAGSIVGGLLVVTIAALVVINIVLGGRGGSTGAADAPRRQVNASDGFDATTEQKENALLVGEWKLRDENPTKSQVTCTFDKDRTWEGVWSAVTPEGIAVHLLVQSGNWRINRHTLVRTRETTKAVKGISTESMPSGPVVNRIIRLDDSFLVLEDSQTQSVYTRIRTW
jgi:DNA-directed RNA polymerase subunit M/transcription elongation factor TFIIS